MMNPLPKKTKAVINHISRIQGQLEKLKTQLAIGADPFEIAALTTSGIKSFDSLRAKMIENYILNDLNADDDVSAKDFERLQAVLKIARA